MDVDEGKALRCEIYRVHGGGRAQDTEGWCIAPGCTYYLVHLRSPVRRDLHVPGHQRGAPGQAEDHVRVHAHGLHHGAGRRPRHHRHVSTHTLTIRQWTGFLCLSWALMWNKFSCSLVKNILLRRSVICLKSYVYLLLHLHDGAALLHANRQWLCRNVSPCWILSAKFCVKCVQDGKNISHVADQPTLTPPATYIVGFLSIPLCNV